MQVLEVPAVPSKPRSHLPPDPEWGDDGRLDLLAPVRAAWRYRVAVGIVTLVAAIAGLITALVLPTRYTGSAIVFVSTTAPNPLDQEAMSVEALRHLATSGSVQARTLADLRKRNVIAAGQQVLDFDAVPYRSVQPSTPYLPMLALTVEATSPDLARDAANAWAAIFKEDAAKFVAATRNSTSDAFVTEYTNSSAKVREAELELDALRRQHALALSKVKNEAAVSLRMTQLWSRDRLVAELEEQLHKLPVDLRAADASVTALEQELQKIQGGPTNAAHVQISEQLAAARVKRNEINGRLGALREEIASVRRDAATIRSALESAERSVDDLERQQRLELHAKERELAVVLSGFGKLRERIGDAAVMKGTTDVSVSLGSPAEAPAGPSGPSKVQYAGVGALLGFIFAVPGAWIADRMRTTSSRA